MKWCLEHMNLGYYTVRSSCIYLRLSCLLLTIHCVYHRLNCSLRALRERFSVRSRSHATDYMDQRCNLGICKEIISVYEGLFFSFLPMSRASRDSRRSLVYSPVWDDRKQSTKTRRTLKWDQNLMFPLFPTMQLQHDS